MEKAICQYALDRVMLYLQSYGVEPSSAVCRRALALIDSCLEEAATREPGTEQATALPAGVLARVIDRLPEYFELPDLEVPPQRPPIRRGSIGYGPAI